MTAPPPHPSAADLARAECSRHPLLFADKQLLRSGNCVELLAVLARRLRVAALFSGGLAAWSLVMAAISFLVPAGTSRGLFSPAVHAWIRTLIAAAMLTCCVLSLRSLGRCLRILHCAQAEGRAL